MTAGGLPCSPCGGLSQPAPLHLLPPGTIYNCPKEVLSHGMLKASPVAQWLRIRLPMQGTRVRALVREDPTCRGATKPVRHNY